VASPPPVRSKPLPGYRASPRVAVGGPYFYLREDERALMKLRAAPTYAIVLFVPLLFLTLAPLVLALLGRLLFPLAQDVPWAWIYGGWGVLVLLVALFAWRRAATTEYALTDQRTYARVGRFVTRLHFTTHDKVTDIRYRQGPLERAFGLASLTFATAGGEVQVAGVREALAVKATAESARDAFVRELLREAAPGALAPDTEDAVGAPTAERPAAPPPIEVPPWTGPRPAYLQTGDTPVWFEKPRAISAVGALRSLAGVVILLVIMSRTQTPLRAFAPLIAVALVALLVGLRLVQLRRTEYVATDRRVYARAGVVGTTVNQLTYDKITDITYTQDVLGRLLGYGSVVVQTAGSQQAPITMVGLADPLAAKESIERWRDRALSEGR